MRLQIQLCPLHAVALAQSLSDVTTEETNKMSIFG